MTEMTKLNISSVNVNAMSRDEFEDDKEEYECWDVLCVENRLHILLEKQGIPRTLQIPCIPLMVATQMIEGFYILSGSCCSCCGYIFSPRGVDDRWN